MAGVLVDSGLNTPLVRDPSHYSRYWGNEHIDVEIPGPAEGDPLTGAFELAGVDPRDVVALCISHFHNDHVGGLRHFAGLGFRCTFNGPSTTGPPRMR